MDIEGIASVASSMAQERTANAVSIAMLKKAMDVQSSMALALIGSVSPVPTTQSLPPHLGNHIDVTA